MNQLCLYPGKSIGLTKHLDVYLLPFYNDFFLESSLSFEEPRKSNLFELYMLLPIDNFCPK